MFRTRISRIVTTALGATLLASIGGYAHAHQTDVHHWFEHQRALTDGGTVGLIEPPISPQSAVNGDRGLTGRHLRKRPAIAQAPAPDCFIEQLKMSEGYVPSGECPGWPSGLAAERWVVDEDKQDGRHAEKALAR